jgi:uncharacterized protein YaaR (DUF327 family)
MEIVPANQRKEEKTKIKGKKRSSEVRDKTIFASELQQTIVHEFQGSLDELMTDLKDQEKRFLESQNIEEMYNYKALVQKVLKMILQEGYKTKTLMRSRKDRANFTIISEINRKLEEISFAITRTNKAFDLMKTIDEIRGLLFDLVY